MKFEEFQQFEKKISEINELRHRFWSDLREIRRQLLGFPNDHYRDELIRFVIDMWESALKEEMRRNNRVPPKRHLLMCPECGQVVPKDHSLYDRKGPEGLYKSDRLCMVCYRPLVDRQKAYCSEICRGIGKSRRWRANNPIKKQLSNYNYLKFLKKEGHFK